MKFLYLKKDLSVFLLFTIFATKMCELFVFHRQMKTMNEFSFLLFLG